MATKPGSILQPTVLDLAWRFKYFIQHLPRQCLYKHEFIRVLFNWQPKDLKADVGITSWITNVMSPGIMRFIHFLHARVKVRLLQSRSPLYKTSPLYKSAMYLVSKNEIGFRLYQRNGSPRLLCYVSELGQ